ncbi:uncharacterized protein LOC129900197 [Solanum dulcamara]|uniref:uncharacterized protein LOC129900197 n=1 Tax=Solanum dulcamara TaxID=45834 RepID=UPI002484D774|nr:uncharacterized protein LOC129900197 [Solanum dulcamara]
MSNRIWSLIQQFMRRHNLLEYNHMPFYDSIHCGACRIRVALIQDFVLTVNDLVSAGFINRLFNVEVSEDERYHRHQVIGGRTLANTYCVQCRSLLGWKLIAVSQPSWNHRVGGFYLRLDKLIYWNNVTLFDFLFGGTNEQAPNDQDGGTDEEQDQNYYRGTNEQDQNYYGGSDEQDHDQNGGADEENADQDGDANEQDHDQNGDANEQDHDQNGGANEENADQDVGTNEQNVDQDSGDANEQNDDEENVGANEQDVNHGDANEQVPNEQDVGANEQNVHQDGDANEQVPNEQDVGANEQNADQDGGQPMKRMKICNLLKSVQFLLSRGYCNIDMLFLFEKNADHDGGANEQAPDEQDGVICQVFKQLTMSCPHVSAVIALLKSIHPDWSSAAIRSALMTTSTINNVVGRPITNATGDNANPLEHGEGHFRPSRAVDPGLIYDATYTDYLLFLCSQNISLDLSYNCPEKVSTASNLNYPSLAIANMRGSSRTVTRVVTNVGKDNSTYVLTLRSPPGYVVDIVPKTLRFSKLGEKHTFNITVTAQSSTESRNEFSFESRSDLSIYINILFSFILYQYLSSIQFCCGRMPPTHCIHCRVCRTRVAFIEDTAAIVRTGPFCRMILKRVFNVQVSDNVYYILLFGTATVANTNCVQCGTIIGSKFIAVTQQNIYFREGRFFMKWDKLSLSNEQVPNEQDVGANQQNAYQDGGVNEQNHDQDGGAPMN